MSLTIDATGTNKYQAPNTSFSDATVITVGSGNALVVTVSFGYAAAAPKPTSVTATWNGISMTALAAIDDAGDFVSSYVFGLRSPTAGAQTLALAWTNSCEIFVDAISFSGAAVTSDATAFPVAGRTTQGKNAGLDTVAVTSAVGHYVVAALSPAVSFAVFTGTTLFFDNTSGASIFAGANYDVGAATVNIGVTSVQNVTIAAVDVAGAGTTYAAFTTPSDAGRRVTKIIGY